MRLRSQTCLMRSALSMSGHTGTRRLKSRLELVNLRVTALGDIARPSLREVGPGSGAGGAVKETRKVYFAESGGLIDCRIYDRYRLGEGDSIAGPAIVWEVDSTTFIHPGTSASVDRYGPPVSR